MRLRATSRFEKDLRRVTRRNKDLGKLWAVVERLLVGQRLEPRHRQHRLSGTWSSSWECHIEPDWLLIWGCEDNVLTLVRTGTHSDLFG